MTENSNIPLVPKYKSPKGRGSPKGITPLYSNDSSELTWREEANCKNQDTSLFFPAASELRLVYITSRAMDLCQDCPVAHHCLYEAMKYNYDGIWGNTLHKQRLYFIRTYLNNDLSNLTLDLATEFVQTTRVNNDVTLSASRRRRRRKALKYELPRQ